MATNIKTIIWTFGDGSYSVEISPSHTYRMAGKYTVTVTLTDINDNVFTNSQIIRVYDWDYLDDEGLHVSVTSECLRLALKASQGNGWSVWRGADWLYPESRHGTLKVVNNAERQVQIVWDARSGLPYIIGEVDQWTDKADDYDGSEIESEIRFPEDRGSAEHYTLESLEHHVHLRPHDEDARGDEGHTALGYRNGFEVDLGMLEDGEQITEAATTTDVPIDGDLVFDRKLEAHRMQLKMTTTTSFWKLVRRRSYYVAKDKAAPPSGRAMSQYDHQEALESNVMWFSRGDNLLLDRVTNVAASGSYLTVITGPDGYSGSAMQFSGTQGFALALTSGLSGDFTMMFWLSSVTVANIITFTGGSVNILAGPIFDFEDGATNHQAAFSFDSSWKHFAVRRKGEVITLYILLWWVFIK
jgi:hypothetical protein